jgi:hypothetical protein
MTRDEHIAPLAELRILKAANVIISSNLRLRSDGLPMATQREPEDPGLAVYFERKGRPMCFACDKYNLVRCNLHAVGLTIEAIRTIERNGASEMMERAFTGFLALPEKASQPWRDVLGLRYDPVTIEGVEAKFREAVRVYHPDVPGSGDRDKYEAAVQARTDARRELGGR